MSDVNNTTNEAIKKLESHFRKDTFCGDVVKWGLKFHVRLKVFVFDSGANNAGW